MHVCPSSAVWMHVTKLCRLKTMRPATLAHRAPVFQTVKWCWSLIFWPDGSVQLFDTTDKLHISRKCKGKPAQVLQGTESLPFVHQTLWTLLIVFVGSVSWITVKLIISLNISMSCELLFTNGALLASQAITDLTMNNVTHQVTLSPLETLGK